MDTFLTILLASPIVLLMFGASIFLHEFGHYWVARKLGMKVEAFAVGFGPKMFGWEKDGIEYSIRWIPAGGFVKLPQMITSEALEGSSDSTEEIPPAPPFSKIAVALAGPAMNVVFAFAIGIVLFFTGVPKLVNPSIIGAVEPGSAEEKLGIQVGDRIVAVNNKTVSTWQNILLASAIARTNNVPVIIERGDVRTTYQLALSGEDGAVGLKMLNLGSGSEPAVGIVQPDTPAEKAGLQEGDKIVEFDKVRVVSHRHLQLLVGRSEGAETTIVVERDGKEVTASLTPIVIEKGKSARIGIVFAPEPQRYELQRPGPLPWVRIREVFDQTFGTLGALSHSKQTGVGLGDMTGPLGILMMLALQVTTDFRLALDFLILLNINLAIINMLPIPVLDGGHVVMSLIEAFMARFFGKKTINHRYKIRLVEYTFAVCAVSLISLMLFVVFNDFKRMNLFKAMFETETKIAESGSGGMLAIVGGGILLLVLALLFYFFKPAKDQD